MCYDLSEGGVRHCVFLFADGLHGIKDVRAGIAITARSGVEGISRSIEEGKSGGIPSVVQFGEGLANLRLSRSWQHSMKAAICFQVPCDAIGGEHAVDHSAVVLVQSDALKLRPEANDEVINSWPVSVPNVAPQALPPATRRAGRRLNSEALADYEVEMAVNAHSTLCLARNEVKGIQEFLAHWLWSVFKIPKRRNVPLLR